MSAAKSVVTRVAIHPACADIGKRAHLGMGTGFHLRPVPSEVASALHFLGSGRALHPQRALYFHLHHWCYQAFPPPEEAMELFALCRGLVHHLC